MKFLGLFPLFLSLVYASAFAESNDSDKISLEAKKVILKYSGDSLEPSKLIINKLDSSVFFLNQSENKAVNLEIDFKGKKIHCHSDNLKLDGSTLKTQKPIKPRDFEILCFPSAGTYSYNVKETGPREKFLKGEIVINE